MRSKPCLACEAIKPITEFHKAGTNSAGKTEYRGKCKPCSNAIARAPKRTHKPLRSTEYIDMPSEQRIQTYEAAILRMKHFGIMSEETAEKALKRVNNGHI